MKIFRRFSVKRYLLFWLAFTLTFVFCIEFVFYYLNTFRWLRPRCDNTKDCTKLLLVSDPQIIGKYKERRHHIAPFSIFDSDMYLKKTYSYAYQFVQPDLVIFLGDLTDEGSRATDEEFYEYVRRIFNIFLDQSTSSVRHIWLPGDNDVGGEEEEVSSYKMRRFERAFAQPDLIRHNNITFFKINRLIQTIPVFKEKREFYDTSQIFIALSHLPLVFMPSSFVERVLSKLLPHAMFTGHEHKSMIVSTDALLRQDRQIIPVTPDNNNNNDDKKKNGHDQIYEYTLGVSDMYEFIIPTCSYRMGTDKIGYGFAVLERNELRYTVLWSPSRFKQLFSYAGLIACFLLSTLAICCCRCCLRLTFLMRGFSSTWPHSTKNKR